MAEGGPRDDLDAELAALVLDDSFVANATITELRPTPPPPPPVDPPGPPADFWTPDRRQLGLRLAIGVMAVLVGVAVLATMKSRGVGQSQSQTPPASHVEAGMYGPGDCLSWPATESQFATLAGPDAVPCAEPHRIEIAGSLRLDDEAGYPTGFRMEQLVDEHCPSLVRDHLGHDLDPSGRFTIGALHPSLDSWRGGDRALWCGIVLRTPAPGPEGGYAEFVGAVD